MAKKIFSNTSLYDVFTSLNYEYEDMKELMEDTARGTFQAGVSQREAEDKIREMFFNVLDLKPEEVTNRKLVRRAMKKNKDLLFEVIEDVVEDMLVQGWGEDPFFMQFVDVRNLADGDKNEFWTEEEITLAVAKISGDHHNVLVQRLGEGESYEVRANRYGAAVGTDIRLFLTGRKDWSSLVSAIYKAFDKKIKDTVYAEVMNVGEKLPVASMFNKAIPVDAAHKADFDDLISDVSAANDSCDVIVMGTKTALKKIGKFTDIDWVSGNMKDKMHEDGMLGYYEGTALVEIPQRLIKKGATLERMIDSNKLLVLPVSMDKFIKLVNVGDPEIVEITEQGATQDDSMKFEYQQSIGVGTQIGKYFGAVKITA